MARVKRKLRKLDKKTKWRIWRHRVFRRDRFTCQLCGQKGGYIEPHHILRKHDHPELTFNVKNGITLCGKCHKMVTGFENEWAFILTKILHKELLEDEWNIFFDGLSLKAKSNIDQQRKAKIKKYILDRIQGWRNRKKKSRKQ